MYALNAWAHPTCTPWCLLPSPAHVAPLGIVVVKPAPTTVTLLQLHTPLPPVTLLKKSDPSGFSAATCDTVR